MVSFKKLNFFFFKCGSFSYTLYKAIINRKNARGSLNKITPNKIGNNNQKTQKIGNKL